MATILLVGVDLFFRGKLDVLLPGHHFVTVDTIAEPELVIADISRIEPEEVADTYPDIPIVGFASHTDTAGLRRAHAAGFDQVLAKSALQERAPEVIGELLAGRVSSQHLLDRRPLTYIIAEPCIDIKDRSCIDVCPVDCIHEYERSS